MHSWQIFDGCVSGLNFIEIICQEHDFYLWLFGISILGLPCEPFIVQYIAEINYENEIDDFSTFNNKIKAITSFPAAGNHVIAFKN